MIEKIKRDILEIYNKNKNIESKIEKHNTIQNEVVLLAKKYYLEGRKEYRVDYISYTKSQKRSGRIDVIWLEGNGQIYLAFEVDSSAKTNSLAKLNKISAKNKIWLCYGNRIDKLNKYDKELNKEKSILILTKND